jgi:spermidine synthase
MLRPVVLALTVLTGFTGLAYEVTWQKYLGILLGAHSEATASVLGLFLGGLSLGYWLFGALTRALVERGRRSGRPAPLLGVYGAVEAGIGLYCVLFPSLFRLVRSASVLLPTGSGALGFAVDVLLAAVLIVPPATLMGGTIPILTQALARSLSDATRLHALVYACNTAGAFVGALATGFLLIDWLGLAGILHALGLVNLAVGSAFALLGLRRRELVALESGEAPELRTGVFAVYGSVALLVGFAMMVLQTIVIRIGGLAFGSSEYTFSMAVAVFVLCIALGSFAVSALPRIGRHMLTATLWCLGLLFTGLYFALETAPYWAHVLRVMFRDLEEAFYPFYAAVFGCILLVIGPAVVLSGAMLPLLFHTLRREVGDLGSQAGRLYSVNTVGSLIGALLGGYALLFWLDLHHVYRIAVCALVLAASIVTLHQYPRIRFAGAAALLLVSFLGIDQLPPWRPIYLMSGTFRDRQPTGWTFAGPSVLSLRQDQFSFHDDDPNSSVAVGDYGSGEALTRSIVVNGKSDGNTRGDYPTMALAALLPALFAERVEHAFAIGFGTGITAGELAELAETQSVTVAEISSGVIEAAPLFDFANHGVSTHPKVKIVHSDAYRALLKGRNSYDVIVSEPSNPWVAGVEMLFSREFLEEARDRLTPRGVYCQWYHYYETSPEAVEIVLNTYTAVFDHVAVWSVNRADLLLLGFRDAESARDLARLERRMQQADFRAGFARLDIGDLPSLLVHETLPLGVAHAAALEGPVHSLYHPRLSFAAGRGFFIGASGSLPFTGYGEVAEIGAGNSLLLRYLERWNGEVPERVWEEIASRACSLQLPGCGALVAAWSHAQPRSEGFQRLVASLRQQYGPLFLGRLRRFFDASPPAGPGPANRIRPAIALEVTRLYMEHYAHGAPFEPGGLLGFWEHCGLDPRGVALCQPGLREAERLVLGDAPPDPRDWLTPVDEEGVRSAAHQAPPPEEIPAVEDEDQ